jgi:hypothetical protein
MPESRFYWDSVGERVRVVGSFFLAEVLFGVGGKIKMSSKLQRFTVGFLALAASACFGTAARASLIPINITGVVGGAYTYNVDFASTAGAEAIQSGDWVTLYDVGPAGGVNALVAPTGWTTTTQLTGTTPLSLMGASGIIDDPTLTNVVFTYIGSALTSSTTFTGFSFTVPSSTGSRSGVFTSEDQVISATNLDQLGSVTMPSIAPEPASVASIVAVAGVAVSRRRIRR